MKKTLTDLLELDKIQDDERNRRNLSIIRGFCPGCGAPLVEIKTRTFLDRLMGDFKTRKYCPVNSSHYDHSEKYLADSW